MSFTIFLTMFSFALVMSISPGPVNMMIITSSINNGFAKTFSFISGATIGFILLLLCIGLGLSKIINLYPDILLYVEIFGFSFIIYLGIKILSSKASLSINTKDKVNLKFYEGFLLQWLNPKAWIACISVISMYSSAELFTIFVIIYFIVCYMSLSFWGILGSKVTKFFDTDLKLQVFNMTMGLVLIFCAIAMILVNLF
ncbi:MAG: lysine transporter LysE [Arcobacter sp.]|uniref:LysE family translocator n=1 Tax=uncultured Arcobacter sp. TaxID=165434 RepID=UPI000CC54A6E|nr:LysE family translocator [uncultured Arcobacter sp.]PLY10079.1 MAG: lysine transporter LysE [Arcobacter sp.]